MISEHRYHFTYLFFKIIFTLNYNSGEHYCCIVFLLKNFEDFSSLVQILRDPTPSLRREKPLPGPHHSQQKHPQGGLGQALYAH